MDWLAKSDLNKTSSLLLNRKKKPMTKETFAKLFQSTNQKYTGVRSRNNDWRTCVVSHHFKDDSSLAKRKNLADRMCHAPTTAQEHYEKK